MRFTKSNLLALVVFPILAVAQAAPPPSLRIRLSSSQSSCFIGEIEIQCKDVGKKLRSMGVDRRTQIHLTGDERVGSPLVRSVLESLERAGYLAGTAYIKAPER